MGPVGLLTGGPDTVQGLDGGPFPCGIGLSVTIDPAIEEASESRVPVPLPFEKPPLEERFEMTADRASCKVQSVSFGQFRGGDRFFAVDVAEDEFDRIIFRANHDVLPC